MQRNLRTVNQFVEENPAFTHGAIRWDLFKAEENGLAAEGAIVRRGGRVYLDVDRYFSWLDKPRPKAARRSRRDAA